MKKKLILITVLIVSVMMLSGCGKQKVRLLVGSTSVTGDTYQNADLIARAIAEEMNVDIKVDPVGSSDVFKELEKGDTDGSTIAFFHDYAYLGYLYGAYDTNWIEKYQVGPTVSINAGTLIAVKEDNKFGITDWDSLVEAAKTNKLVMGIQEGSVSHFISEGIKNYLVKNEGVPAENIEFNPLGSSQTHREALWAGTIDVLTAGSYATDSQNTRAAGNTDEKTMETLIAVTGDKPLEGLDVPALGELTGGKLSFDKEFFFMTKKGTDEEFMKKLETAVKNALENNQGYKKNLSTLYFKPDFRPLDESITHFDEKMAEAKSIIQKR